MIHIQSEPKLFLLDFLYYCISLAYPAAPMSGISASLQQAGEECTRCAFSSCHVFYPSRLLEAGGYCISFVVKGSRYVTTASPLTPRISPIAGSANSILDFCSNRVHSQDIYLKLPVAPPHWAGFPLRSNKPPGSHPNVRNYTFFVIRSHSPQLAAGNALVVHFH